MKATLLPLALLVGSAGCATYSGPVVHGAPIRNNGFAAVGQPTRVGTVVITPQAVIEDSRCPMNARCVWAGQVIIKAQIDGAGWRETTDLKLGEPYRTRGATIALTSVRPEKMARQAPPAEYLFGFESR